jgi:hypothetical protein
LFGQLTNVQKSALVGGYNVVEKAFDRQPASQLVHVRPAHGIMGIHDIMGI